MTKGFGNTYKGNLLNKEQLERRRAEREGRSEEYLRKKEEDKKSLENYRMKKKMKNIFLLIIIPLTIVLIISLIDWVRRIL
jgi:hypothetical protein